MLSVVAMPPSAASGPIDIEDIDFLEVLGHESFGEEAGGEQGQAGNPATPPPKRMKVRAEASGEGDACEEELFEYAFSGTAGNEFLGVKAELADGDPARSTVSERSGEEPRPESLCYACQVHCRVTWPTALVNVGGRVFQIAFEGCKSSGTRPCQSRGSRAGRFRYGFGGKRACCHRRHWHPFVLPT